MSKLDVDSVRVREKLAYVKEQVEDLKLLQSQTDAETFSGDQWLVRGVRYSLQTAIEAMIDVAYHVSAKAFSHGPKNARDALRTLGQHGVLSKDDVKTYSDMVGFRNRVVHGYETITDERLYKIMSEELDDFERFIKSIVSFMDLDGNESHDSS